MQHHLMRGPTRSAMAVSFREAAGYGGGSSAFPHMRPSQGKCPSRTGLPTSEPHRQLVRGYGSATIINKQNNPMCLSFSTTRNITSTTSASSSSASSSSSPSTALSSGGKNVLLPDDADISGVEGRYAKALFAAAKDMKSIEAVNKDLQLLRSAMKENSQFSVFVESPGIPSTTKAETLADLSKAMQLNPLTQNFLEVLLDNRRFPLLQRLAERFEQFYQAAKGQVHCSIISAKNLNEKEKGEIVKALQQREGANVTLVCAYSVDPEILGGLVVKSQGRILDFSLRAELDRLERLLSQPL